MSIKLTNVFETMSNEMSSFVKNLDTNILQNITLLLVCIVCITIVLHIVSKNDTLKKWCSNTILASVLLYICYMYDNAHFQLLLNGFICLAVLSILCNRLLTIFNDSMFKKLMSSCKKIIKDYFEINVEIAKEVFCPMLKVVRALWKRFIVFWYRKVLNRRGYWCDKDVLKASSLVGYSKEHWNNDAELKITNE